ncbi:MAG: molybdenum cofactor biosynthesis protein B [Hyphomicrobiaceae bacterium]
MSKHHHHDDRRTVGCAILTVSDTRTQADDRSGALIRELLEGAGHRIVDQEILPDEPSVVAAEVARMADEPAIEAILVTGGTGLAARDTTYEALDGLLEKRLDGFGELFRFLSYEEIGPAAMLSRAAGGVIGTTVVFSMPGSTAACRLAVERLILPQLGHVAGLLAE